MNAGEGLRKLTAYAAGFTTALTGIAIDQHAWVSVGGFACSTILFGLAAITRGPRVR